MARLKGDARERVLKALGEAFDVRELDRILRTHLDMDLFGDNLPHIEADAIDQVLRRVESQGCTAKLLKALKDKRPENESFRQEMDEALALLASAPVKAPPEQQPASAPAHAPDKPDEAAPSATAASSAALVRRPRKSVAARWRILSVLAVLAIVIAAVCIFSVSPACKKNGSKHPVYIHYPDSSLKDEAEELRKSIRA